MSWLRTLSESNLREEILWLTVLGNTVYLGSDSMVLRLDWCSWELMAYSHGGRLAGSELRPKAD